MATLHHSPLHPASRYVRLLLAEYGIELTLNTIVPWDSSGELVALNPAGSLPVFQDNQSGLIP
ncbi:MAG: glutathione S-transferase N-terminal domain-containing protein, partial [Pseudomonadota bacterium]|nr:glutathione S-transferase N-terminal domain-containing protein [Pseudomonadota bacterium]